NGIRPTPPAHPRTQHVAKRSRRVARDLRPVAAFRQRAQHTGIKLEDFSAPERWHDPREGKRVRYLLQPAGKGFVHAVTIDEVRERRTRLPARFPRGLSAVQFSAMTRKRQLFPCYGMQWGSAVYLYPIEETFVETYRRPPTPQQEIEASMYGGR